MALHKDFDLEGQGAEGVNSLPNVPPVEQPFSDIGSHSVPNGVADTKRPSKEDATRHLEGSTDGPHGSPEYYRHLVKLALTGSQLDNHALSFDFLHRLVLLDHQKTLAEHFRKAVHDSTVTNAEILEISNSLHEYSVFSRSYCNIK